MAGEVQIDEIAWLHAGRQVAKRAPDRGKGGGRRHPIGQNGDILRGERHRGGSGQIGLHQRDIVGGAVQPIAVGQTGIAAGPDQEGMIFPRGGGAGEKGDGEKDGAHGQFVIRA